MGVGRPGEADRTLVASAYVEGCSSCPGSTPKWDIAGGLQSLLADRGAPRRAIQRFRTGAAPTEALSFDDLAKALEAGTRVIATLCYDPGGGDPAVAAQRAGRCLTVAVIGTVRANAKSYLVARDGLAEGQECEAAADRANPAELGLADKPGPWHDAGTGLYRWDGRESNIVVVLLEGAEHPWADEAT